MEINKHWKCLELQEAITQCLTRCYVRVRSVMDEKEHDPTSALPSAPLSKCSADCQSQYDPAAQYQADYQP